MSDGINHWHSEFVFCIFLWIPLLFHRFRILRYTYLTYQLISIIIILLGRFMTSFSRVPPSTSNSRGGRPTGSSTVVLSLGLKVGKPGSSLDASRTRFVTLNVTSTHPPLTLSGQIRNDGSKDVVIIIPGDPRGGVGWWSESRKPIPGLRIFSPTIKRTGKWWLHLWDPFTGPRGFQ